MPMKSLAQRRYLWARHPKLAKRFERETPAGKKLPERVGKKKPYFVKEPYGLPFELTEAGKFRKPKTKRKYWNFPKGKPAPNNYLWDGVGWTPIIVKKPCLIHQDTGKIISQKDYLDMVNEEEKEKYFPILNKKR